MLFQWRLSFNTNLGRDTNISTIAKLPGREHWHGQEPEKREHRNKSSSFSGQEAETFGRKLLRTNERIFSNLMC
jgi:hypothetical protein